MISWTPLHTHFLTSILRTGVLCLVAVGGPARAETVDCTPITTVPITLTTQGIYCFTQDIATNLVGGNAIEIATNNVTIDMNGHKLGNLAAGASNQAYGFYTYQRKNITLKNGTIRGFYYGVWLDDASPYTASSGHVLEDLRADGNTVIGLFVEGSGNIVRRNQVVSTGGSTATPLAIGIESYGPGAQVLDNIVNGILGQAAGDAVGIQLAEADGGMAARNHVSNVSGGVVDYGIYIASSDDVIVSDNRLSKMEYGVFYNASTGAYMNNLVRGAATPYSGGTAAGTTNY